MKRILTFLLLVAALVIAASYTAPRPSIESIELPPGPPTEVEMAELLATTPSVWPSPEPVSTEVYTVTVWPTETEIHTITMWPDLEPVHTLSVWPGPELLSTEVHEVTISTPTSWPVPALVWNLVGNPYVYMKTLQPLFRYLQLWWQLERQLP